MFLALYSNSLQMITCRILCEKLYSKLFAPYFPTLSGIPALAGLMHTAKLKINNKNTTKPSIINYHTNLKKSKKGGTFSRLSI